MVRIEPAGRIILSRFLETNEEFLARKQQRRHSTRKEEKNMKLKLRDKQLPPVQLRLVVPAELKERLDEYVGFVHGISGREVETREVAVEMLEQFIASDREFRRWQKRNQASLQKGKLNDGQRGAQINGQVSA